MASSVKLEHEVGKGEKYGTPQDKQNRTKLQKESVQEPFLAYDWDPCRCGVALNGEIGPVFYQDVPGLIMPLPPTTPAEVKI